MNLKELHSNRRSRYSNKTFTCDKYSNRAVGRECLQAWKYVSKIGNF